MNVLIKNHTAAETLIILFLVVISFMCGGTVRAEISASANILKDTIPEEEYKFIKHEDRKPQFSRGDENNFTKWVFSRLRYPGEILLNGKVVVSFVINMDGTMGEIKIIQSLNRDFDNEVRRVISQSPKWLPGIQNNKPVKVRYSFPVVFGYHQDAGQENNMFN